MAKDKILVIGACGQIGVELTLALREAFGKNNVIASDLREESILLKGTGPYIQMSVMDKEKLQDIIKKQKITQVYLLAAVLSATGEKKPMIAWDLNMKGLLNILEIAREEKLQKVYWPSSIAVFGPSSPKKNCPQQTIIEPTTVYGISKLAGENWCNYYFQKYGVDVRSLRYPGLISYKSEPGGGTTDYAVEIFYEALRKQQYTCFLSANTYLPMMYMPDAIRATIELMEAPAKKIKIHNSYNLSGISFSPKDIAKEIKKHIPSFKINYAPDYRQKIAESWPQSIDDLKTKKDWGWKHQYDLGKMTSDMIQHLSLNFK
ncbi:MAG: NAD-dependent epimerase/dehydratase family protein [Bacteroidetes bacterium]|nr:NAD-dependent epimerase/dehydratase family protein [Bacteroidota bacterium]